jgi:peroxiredoxin
VTGPLEQEPAPDVPLLDMEAREASLSTYWRREPAVVVFLRYFGCPFCQAQVVQLRDERELFADLGAGIVLIGQGSPSEAVAFTERMKAPFDCLVDPDRSAYRAFGLARGTPAQLYGPKVAVPFIQRNVNRETLQRGLRGGSFQQMPGTFVIDTGGVVQMAHRNRHVADNPTNHRILEVLASLWSRARG